MSQILQPISNHSLTWILQCNGVKAILIFGSICCRLQKVGTMLFANLHLQVCKKYWEDIYYPLSWSYIRVPDLLNPKAKFDKSKLCDFCRTYAFQHLPPKGYERCTIPLYFQVPNSMGFSSRDVVGILWS